jgi:hypothetical protein
MLSRKMIIGLRKAKISEIIHFSISNNDMYNKIKHALIELIELFLDK